MKKRNGLTEEDSLFLRKAEDCAQAAERYRSARFTKFISPHEREVFRSSADLSPFVSAEIWGGIDDAERTVIGFFPDFSEPEKELFPIDALRIGAREELGHRDVLGSVLGLGIERSLLGDIISCETGAVLFCLSSCSDFICMNLEQVGRKKVTVERCERSELVAVRKQTKECTAVVASLRLDCVVGAGTGVSRTKAQELIGAGLVQCNWMTVENCAYVVSEGEMLSVRGFGRWKFVSDQGETKKGRHRIILEQYI